MKTIPILGADDMVGSGFVRSTARPSGNITIVSILAPELDDMRKKFLLKPPGLRRFAMLADCNTTKQAQFDVLRGVA
jgi:putative tryptophan/tyrosine transport system substrate-binding protein